MRPIGHGGVRLCALTAAVLASVPEAQAVRLEPEGLGQALIFPYYTAQSLNGDPLNTYVSIVNTTPQAKTVRVRFREGRMGAEALSFNLFLSPNDVWTGALAATADGTQLLSTDSSCTDPAFSAGPIPFMTFSNAAFSGNHDDGAGTGLDRTREGFIEAIEMATLTGASATAVTHTASGAPADCAAVRGSASLTTGAPTGGLSGGETLINVANGMEFVLNATALADLSTRAFFRPASDPYPDFNSTEIDPVSVVLANGAMYRSAWSLPVDAVSAVLMHPTFLGEFGLDAGTASNTDVVVTFPTRQFYVSATSARYPFTLPSTWAPHCQAPGSGNQNEYIATSMFNREESGFVISSDCGFPECPPGPPATALCAATVVMDVSNGTSRTAIGAASRVLGSLVRGYGPDGLKVPGSFNNGWLRSTFASRGPGEIGLASLPSSTRVDLATGATTSGAQVYLGLPLVGFTARTLVNGTLHCDTGICQGNYGGAFPLQYTRSIAP